MAGKGAVIVVEDEIIVGMDLAMSLESAGYTVIGPYASASAALAALADAEAEPVAGVLDVNLGDGQTSEPVAEKLQAMDAPFLFLTGYASGRNAVFERFPDIPRLSKPCMPEALMAAVDRIARNGRSA
ncbi:MAG: response regulator [Oceanicaulis sp.]